VLNTNVNSVQYALVNVLSGSTYRFTIGNLSDNENLTILDASTNASLQEAIQVQVAHRF
jgi:hypothetical protein